MLNFEKKVFANVYQKVTKAFEKPIPKKSHFISSFLIQRWDVLSNVIARNVCGHYDLDEYDYDEFKGGFHKKNADKSGDLPNFPRPPHPRLVFFRIKKYDP